jgi:hypothetical protein
MRTTITLDDDLAVRLERRRAEQGTTFKQVLNESVRVGLGTLDHGDAGPVEPTRTVPLRLGRRLLGDVDDVADALAVAEGEDFA